MTKASHILVVDDDPYIRQVFTRALRTRGYLVSQAANGEDGLKLAKETRPDLVILDVVLPDISGVEVCRLIKADPALIDVFVVLVSGEALTSVQKVDGLDTGADDYLAKPMVMSEFLARIRASERLQRSNAALRASEQHYRRLVEILPDAVGLVDKRGRIIQVNQRAASMLGYDSAVALRGKKAIELVDSKSRPHFRAAVVAMFKGNHALRNLEFQGIKRDGSRFPVEISATLSNDLIDSSREIVIVARDLTERKQAEQELEKSRLQAKAILDNIPDPAWLMDTSGRFLACNDSLSRFYGISNEELVGRTVLELSPREAEKIIKEEAEVICSGKPMVSDQMLSNAQGNRVCFEIAKSPIINEFRVVTGIVGIARDVTERRWAENLLHIQRDFSVFLSSTNEMKDAADRLLTVALQNEGFDCGAVYLSDPETGTLYLETHRGFTPFFTQRFSSLVALKRNASGQFEVNWEAEDLRKEGLIAMKSAVMRHNNEIVAIIALGSHFPLPIPDRSRRAVEALASQAEDALARIRVEQSLRANRQLLEMTLHSIRSAVFLMDADKAVIKNCNPAATQIFGFAYEEMIGQSPLILHEDRQSQRHFNRLWKDELKSNGLVRDFEYKMKRKDGVVFHTEHSMMPIKHKDGSIIAWVSVVRDITDRKRLEDELRQFPQRVIEAQEAERLRVARELHDGVNQLLATAKMRLLKVEQHLVNISPLAREMLARCNKLMVQALEENRRIAHNLRPSELDALGLATACKNVCEIVQSRNPFKITCDIGQFDRMLPEMELNLFRIFQEALTNIEKHAQAKHVHIQIHPHGDFLVLRIQDDGRGFPPPELATKPGMWGGMGQKNMKERAAILGGTFEMASTQGKGATITVRVPFRI